MDIEKELQEIFDDPLFSDVKPTEIKPTSDDRLVLSFEEINNFYELNRRLPSETKGMKEKLMLRHPRPMPDNQYLTEQLP